MQRVSLYSIAALVIFALIQGTAALPRWIPGGLARHVVTPLENEIPTMTDNKVSPLTWPQTFINLLLVREDHRDWENALVYLYVLLGIWLVVGSARRKLQESQYHCYYYDPCSKQGDSVW